MSSAVLQKSIVWVSLCAMLLFPNAFAQDDNFEDDIEVMQGTAANTIIENVWVSGGTFLSGQERENALRLTGDIVVSFDDVSVEKRTGDTDSANDSNLFGLNAGLLITDGAQLNIKDSSISTNAVGGNALFVHENGSAVALNATTVHTQQDLSSGLHIAFGGSIAADKPKVETWGNSSAAIRIDNGGGNHTANGGSYITNGSASPAIYTTGDVFAQNATLTANNSEVFTLLDRASLSLENCTIKRAGIGSDLSTERAVTIASSSAVPGASEKSRLSITGGRMSLSSVSLFYVDHTPCEIFLKNVKITGGNGRILSVVDSPDSAFGGDCTLTMERQTLEGNIIVEEASTLTLNLTSRSRLVGAINPDGEGGDVHVSLSNDSRWALTGNTYITTFTGNRKHVVRNGYTLHIAQPEEQPAQ